ncbi:MAG: hypothetical protein RR844_01995, partial [Clostridium sp.]
MDICFFFNLSYKKLKCLLFLIILLLFFTNNNALASTVNSNTLDFNLKYKEILILTSKADNMLWEGKLLEYLLKQFSSDPSIRLHTEILSSVNIDEEYMNKEAEFLLMKYAKNKFNLILCLDDESIEFVAKYYDNPALYNSPI